MSGFHLHDKNTSDFGTVTGYTHSRAQHSSVH